MGTERNSAEGLQERWEIARSAPRWILLTFTVGLCFLAVFASPAFADGTVTVTIEGSGSGTVSSTTNGSGGPIDCHYDGAAQSGTCSAPFSGGTFGLTKVTLTASPTAGLSLFAGWSQGGATLSEHCTTPPEGDGSCVVSLLLGASAHVTATFEPLPDPPLVETSAASGVTGTGAAMRGTVNPGGAPVTDCRFEYGTNASYGASVPCEPGPVGVGEGDQPVAVSAATESLEPGSTYHYRIVAANAGGLSKGEDRSFATAGAPACSNAARRVEQGIRAVQLPDCMALELVSPPEKWLSSAFWPSISADGSRIVFRSAAALDGTSGPGLPLTPDVYVAGRTANGWLTSSTAPPREWGFRTFEDGIAESLTPDFGAWISRQATADQRVRGASALYEANLDGFWRPRSPLLVPLNRPAGEGAVGGAAEVLQGVSRDGTHLFLRVRDPGNGDLDRRWPTYLPGDPEATVSSGSVGNGYVIGTGPGGDPTLQLLARDVSGKVWGGTCGASIGSGPPSDGSNIGNTRNQGSVSADGSLSFFSTRSVQPQPDPADPSQPACDTSNPLRIMERRETPAGVQITELLPPLPASGSDFFQGASLDGTKVFFTTTRPLAATDQDSSAVDCVGNAAVAGCDLYLYERLPGGGHEIVQVSAGDSTDPTPGEGARVYNGVTAISSDGSHIYFVAAGVLTTDPNPAGAVAVAGKPNLYLYERGAANPTGRTAFVGTLESADGGFSEALFGAVSRSFTGQAEALPMLGAGAEDRSVGGDGHLLVFLSSAALTSADADGSHRDVYRYDSGEAGQLICVSCAPGGADAAPIDVDVQESPGGKKNPTNQAFAELGRWASEDGRTIAFETPQPLVGGDADESTSAYLWREGRLYVLPASKPAGAEGRFYRLAPNVSHDGSEVAFQSFDPLIPQDGDASGDVYVARVGGGFAAAAAPPACLGEACQGPAAALPPPTAAATTGFVGPGNVKPSRKHKHRKHKKRHRRHAGHKSRHGRNKGHKPHKAGRRHARGRGHAKRLGSKHKQSGAANAAAAHRREGGR